ncbi:uncharacterized protein L969DRAFT_70511 [Mixia osmundae IAM 14324]|uniref:proteasome endopeptidase complex n=1 Tax=Mixia osmundae (strain CBS 9802 / IAM 14324 / JCM 22182 / KY 12970) TaxID=764103 RepID=G7DXN5_MIXOS|nr:uncharacterized protein L969DRAFT_70511 [Mixia osmundae IAM 14324]KEI41162.1 hypothetical protein L969DRAFT_70511 [Mixia osmundae IAM 14324]GAA95345.1 hypothetical protein E5Q_02002 [Mixia osmundae IAM 14324]
MAALNDSRTSSGFDFGNHLRNEHLMGMRTSQAHASTSYSAGPTSSRAVQLPKSTSTGTTIVGCIFDDGVVLGADTRATEGPIVADKNCEKIHYITDNIRCCGAGTAADTEFTTAMISSNMQLHSLSVGRPARVVTAMTMLKQYLFRYQGHVGAALVLGGYDVSGPQLFTVAPHGSTDKLPYVTMGSGSLAAMAVFESKWTAKMSRQDAMDLVAEAIEAGIFNDLGSGSNVDVCIIEKGKTEMLRNWRKPNERVQKEMSYKPKLGTTVWKKEMVKSLIVKTEVIPTQIAPVTGAAGDSMQVDA